MNCPYCNALMEKGGFNLAKPPLGGRAYVNVWLCRGCSLRPID